MICDKTDCVHYDVCEEWRSLGNDNYITCSNGHCDFYKAKQPQGKRGVGAFGADMKGGDTE